MAMLYWTTYPFVRILLALIAGILVANHSAENVPANHHILFLFLALLLAKIFFKGISNLVWGNLLLGLVFLIGFVAAIGIRQTKPKDFPGSNKAYIGIVSSFPTSKGSNLGFEVQVSCLAQDSIVIDQPSKVLVKLKLSDTTTYTPKFGDKILIEGTPRPISSPKNLYAFDYKKYMANRGIHYQQYLTEDKITLISTDQVNSLLAFVFDLRSQIERRIELSVQSSAEQNIIKALLLGIKSDLDPEIKSAYAAAGAMHVLAVSGLHVSVVYFIVNWIFGLFPTAQVRRWIAPTVSILALWFYALLTGFSPSILRAVTMISILIASKMLRRRTNIFNSLAFAAFALLLYNPKFITDVGFQLSFLAIGGIVYLHPKISDLWHIKHWLGDKIWQLTSVSLAAQLATFPISLYYFHQFPTFFLLTNLIVIPGAFIIMILSLVLVAFGHWFEWIGELCGFVVKTLNQFVSFIESLDGSLIDGISISGSQLILIYLLMICVIGLCQHKEFYYVWLIGCIAVALSSILIFKLVYQSGNTQLMFYSSSKTLLIDEISGLKANLISTDSAVSQMTLKYAVDPYRLKSAIPKTDHALLLNQNLAAFATVRVFNGVKTIVVRSALDPVLIKKPIKADIVVISNQSIHSISDFNKIFDCRKVILDASNSNHYRSRLKKELQNIEVEIIDLTQSYYLMNLSGD